MSANVARLFHGDYISGAELGQHEVTLTIAKLVQEEWTSDACTTVVTVLYLTEVRQGWVINQTNRQCLRAMFGPDTSRWIGRRVTLHAAEAMLGEERRIGIRVKGSPDLVDTLDALVVLRHHEPFYVRLVPTRVSWIRRPARDEAA